MWFCTCVHRLCPCSCCRCIEHTSFVSCSPFYVGLEEPKTSHMSPGLPPLTILAPPQPIMILFCFVCTVDMRPRLITTTRHSIYLLAAPKHIYVFPSIHPHPYCPPWDYMDIPDPLLNYVTFYPFCYALFSPLVCVFSVFVCVFWCVSYVYLS